MIELRNVGIAAHGRTVLERSSATLRSATVTHLSGTPGSGKSMLVGAIAGVQRHSGSIRFDGADVTRVGSALYVCFEDAPLFPYLSGYENVRQLCGRSLGKSAIAAIGPALADDSILRVRAHRLSEGQRRRLHLLAALASGARYLVFDEVLTGVDAPTATEVGDALRRCAPGATVLVTGHRDDTPGALTSRRIDIVNGSLVADDRVVHKVTG